MATITTARTASVPTTENQGPLGNGKVWHRSAPTAVTRSCRPGKPGTGWDAWTAYLVRRKEPRPIASLVDSRRCPVTWNLPNGFERSDRTDLIVDLARLCSGNGAPSKTWRGRLQRWLESASYAHDDDLYPLECVAVAHHLPHLAAGIPAGLWWKLLDHLLASAGAVTATDLTTSPLRTQLLAGELPLVLAYLLPEIRACRRLRKDARRVLSAGLEELLDGEGLPHSCYLPVWGPLLACWTRCQAIGQVLPSGCWNGQADAQYEWLVTQSLRFTRRDGTLMLSAGGAAMLTPDPLATALVLSGDPTDAAAAITVLPELAKRIRVGRGIGVDDLPRPAVNSEWAGLAAMRTDWSRAARRLAIDYDGRSTQLELDCGRDVVLTGTWGFEIRLDGNPAEPTGDWEEVCWIADEEADYLELEIEMEAGARLQRQILLAREDRFLYLADVILGGPARHIQYESTLPLGPSIGYDPAAESWEGYLTGAKRRGLVLPLALPEWRGETRSDVRGSLHRAADTLTLQCAAARQNLCCPLFIDLDPRRLGRQRTWRPLTVAASLQVQTPDVAVGYRVQCGQDQWLIYRSLAAPANRSLLGQNLASDFLLSRFLRSGEIEEIVEIE